MVRLRWVLATSVAVSFPRWATAEPTTNQALVLTIQGPASCPTGDQLRREVLRMARVEPQQPGLLAAKLVVEQAPRHYDLRLVTDFDGITGERTYQGASCRTVTDAAVVTLALMLNPEAEVPESAPPVASEAPREPPSIPPKDNEPSARSERASDPIQLAGILGVFGGGQLGSLPEPGPEFGLGVGLKANAIELLLQGSYAPPQDELIADDVGGRVWLASASLTACWMGIGDRTWSAGPCAGMALSRVAGRGQRVSDPESGSIRYPSLVAALVASGRIADHWSLRAELAGLMPLARPRLFLQDIGDVHRPSQWAGRLQAGVTLDLW